MCETRYKLHMKISDHFIQYLNMKIWFCCLSAHLKVMQRCNAREETWSDTAESGLKHRYVKLTTFSDWEKQHLVHPRYLKLFYTKRKLLHSHSSRKSGVCALRELAFEAAGKFFTKDLKVKRRKPKLHLFNRNVCPLSYLVKNPKRLQDYSSSSTTPGRPHIHTHICSSSTVEPSAL